MTQSESAECPEYHLLLIVLKPNRNLKCIPVLAGRRRDASPYQAILCEIAILSLSGLMQTHAQALIQKWLSQPLDRAATLLMLGLSLLIGLLLLGGNHTVAQVRDFSWQDKQVGVEDTAFILTFNRPMDQASVESNLRISPPLTGKIGWAGQRMAYTPTKPAPYGTAFQVQLIGAWDRFTEQGSRRTIRPFVSHFQTRDRAFAYLGAQGNETGRLIFYNLTRQQKQVLTPPDLVVSEFKFYPSGDHILFSATDRAAQAQGLFDPKLYTVSTGFHPNSPSQAMASPVQSEQSWEWLFQSSAEQAPAGQVRLILDNAEYQLLKFDLSSDGQAIVVQRTDRRNLAQSGLWVLKPDSPPQLLDSQPGGDFLITPDSSALVIAQGQGLAILPLDAQRTSQPLDFLPKFGMVLSFARDGSAAAMVKFNTDYTRSLFQVTNQGTQQELLRTTGSIRSAQFDPLKQTLYCLLTQLLPGSDYQEQPYLAAIDLQTGKLTPLLILPTQQDLQISLAPDGVALLFDQPTSGSQANASNQEAVAASNNLWVLPISSLYSSGDPAVASKNLPQAQPKPEALPLPGLHPQWLP